MLGESFGGNTKLERSWMFMIKSAMSVRRWFHASWKLFDFYGSFQEKSKSVNFNLKMFRKKLFLCPLKVNFFGLKFWTEIRKLVDRLQAFNSISEFKSMSSSDLNTNQMNDNERGNILLFLSRPDDSIPVEPLRSKHAINKREHLQQCVQWAHFIGINPLRLFPLKQQ